MFIKINRPTSNIYSVAISPNHKYLVTGSADKTARIWTVPNGQEIISLKHEGHVISVAFSSDSKYLVTGSADKTARIWTVPNGQEISRLTYDTNLTAVSFSPDMKYLIVTDNNGVVKISLWQRGDLINEACKRLTHNLTPEEWDQYLQNEPYCKTCPDL